MKKALLLAVTALFCAVSTAFAQQIPAGPASPPVVQVRTVGPPAVNADTIASYEVIVTNTGNSTAAEVLLRTQIPATAELIKAEPQPDLVQDTTLHFEIGDIAPRQSVQIKIDLIPRETGAILLQTKTSFSVSTAAAVQVRRPQLDIKVECPQAVYFGDAIQCTLEISNQGDGPAEEVVLFADIPPEAVHDSSKADFLNLGKLEPGAVQQLRFMAKGGLLGELQAKFRLTSALENDKTAAAVIRVVEPKLAVDIAGPAMRYVHCEGKYEISVKNPGSGTARNVSVRLVLTPGLRLKEVSREGSFDPRQNTISWVIPALLPGETETIDLSAFPTEEGEQIQEVAALADRGLVANAHRVVQAIGRPNITMAIANTNGPTEVGQPTKFDIVLANHGTKEAANLSVEVDLLDGLQAIESADYAIHEGRIIFPTINLATGNRKVLSFSATSQTPGNQGLRVSYRSDSLEEKVVEGSGFFYEENDSQSAQQPTLAPSLR